MPSARHFLSGLFVAILAAGLAAADDLEKLRGQVRRETDPVERAKLTAKLGDELLKQIAAEYKQEKYETGEQVLNEYMDAVRAAYRGLQASGRNARKKPGGFKQLEIHLRKSDRVLEDLAKQAPQDLRERMQKAMDELEEIHAGLLEALMGGHPPPRSDI